MDKKFKGINKSLDKETLKKYFNQKTFAGISIVGLVIVLMLYVFVFLNFQSKTEELEAANATKQKEVDELEEYYNNMAQYETDIRTMTDQIRDVLEQYPADAREEDILMLAAQTQEKNAIGYDSINMETPEVVLDIPNELVTNANLEDYTQAMQFVRRHAIYVNTTTYTDLKNVIGEIFNTPDRIAIDNIVYTKNEESGLLEGSINLYMYSVTGTNKEYTAPEMKAYPAGTKDVFGSDITSKASDNSNGTDEGSVADEGSGETQQN